MQSSFTQGRLSPRTHVHALAVITMALASLITSTALADRVLVLRPAGPASQEALDDFEDAVASAVRSIGHETLSETSHGGVQAEEAPRSPNEMRAVAELEGAQWVIFAHVTTLRQDVHQVLFRVGYAPEERVEELNATVYRDDRDERLAAIFAALLRAEGLGDDDVRLTTGYLEQRASRQRGASGSDDGATTDSVGDEVDAEGQAQSAREAFERRERERKANADRDAALAWENRERYGEHGGRWIVLGGLDLRPIIAHPARGGAGADTAGGVLAAVSGRVGYAMPEWIRGLELRGGLDLVTGASSGLGLGAGAAYLHSFFDDLPVFIGGSAEIGMYAPFTGGRTPFFMVRLSPTGAWRPTENFWLEASLPEFMALIGDGGAATLGLTVRAGFRFE